MRRFRYIILILSLILGDVFFFPVSSDVRIFGVLCLYAILIKLLKFKSKTTFGISLVLLFFSYFFYVFSDPSVFAKPVVPVAERAAVWLYLFLVIGVIQKWRE